MDKLQLTNEHKSNIQHKPPLRQRLSDEADLPILVGARIESDTAYAGLDELGRFRCEDLAKRVLGHSHDMLRFMPPEAKGALLYHLTETFWLSPYGVFWISREELQEDAALKILSLIQTRREFREVCEHMTEDGSKSVCDDPYQAGYDRLKTLFDFSQYIRFLQLDMDWRTKERQEELEKLKARKDRRLSLIRNLDTFYPEEPRRWASIEETFNPNNIA